MRRKVDERIRILIENGVKTRHRSLFVIIGDKYQDQIVNLHYMLSKAVVKSRPNVLWCYKNKLELSSHKKKRVKQLKRLMQSGLHDRDKADPLSLFLETAGLTYCLYKDSERILGMTFGMCILQDFEALTPNLLARTIETVEGGGLILLLIRSLSSLTSLYTMVMDVHERFRTESHSEATGRFNERFLLSLASCKACIVMDDELNILPISSHIKSIKPIPVKEDSEGLLEVEQNLNHLKEELIDGFPVGPLIKCSTLDQGKVCIVKDCEINIQPTFIHNKSIKLGLEGLSEAEQDLKHLKEELIDDYPVGPLMKKCSTLDQGKAVITFLDAILDKALQSTVACLAARGRGKSSALGLAIAGAVAVGYPSIYVTAPIPENLKTLFDFVCKGLDALDYKEHMDYDVVRSANAEFKKAVIRININKQSRQTIQYIQPHEREKLSQVDLLVIDEAAAIPLPIVKSLLGPYLVFLSSTVNGYEGTGRSLSLKLIHQLERQSQISTQNVEGSKSGHLFKKIELNESIRYASGDPIESWLHGLLCLDVTNAVPKLSGLPHPSECELYYVNRDTLFSYHKESEVFLQRMMTLYVSSHYKNSPNDLQLMADAPAHHLFVLLGPVDESKNQLPDILCVIQVSLEGHISRKSALKSLSTGRQPPGDQIPWKFTEQFQDTVFPTLSGVRIVRIATHPSATRLGYGSQAVKLLTRYYEGQFAPISESDSENLEDTPPVSVVEAAKQVSLLEETIEPRKDLPHLLVHLRERRPEKLHYVGVSFGLTLELLRFWKKHKFVPFLISYTPSPVTGEHTCMLLKPLANDDVETSGFGPYFQDFRLRFLELLGDDDAFSKMECKLAMSVLDPKINFAEQESGDSTSDGILTSINGIFSTYDVKRLEAYTNNLLDYRTILDIIRKLALLYFQERLPITLSYPQVCILLSKGLQGRSISQIKAQIGLETHQILSLLAKVMRKLYKYLYGIASHEIESSITRLSEIVKEPNDVSMDEDLKRAAMEVEEQMKPNMMGVLDPELLQQYAIGADFEGTLLNGGGKVVPSGGVVSVKSSRKESKIGQKRSKSDHGLKSIRKKKKKNPQTVTRRQA